MAVKKSDKQVYHAQRRRVHLVVGGALLLAVVSLLLAYCGTQARKPAAPASASSSPGQAQERTLTGKSLEEDKKNAQAAATQLLQRALVSKSKSTGEARLRELDNGNFSSMDPAVKEAITFGPDSTVGMEGTVYQSLITMASLAQKGNGKGTVAPLSDNSWRQCYGEPALGIIFVPFSNYAGSGASFSLEMVWLEGKWKLAPYSLVDALKVSLSAQGQGSSTPAASSPSGGQGPLVTPAP